MSNTQRSAYSPSGWKVPLSSSSFTLFYFEMSWLHGFKSFSRAILHRKNNLLPRSVLRPKFFITFHHDCSTNQPYLLNLDNLYIFFTSRRWQRRCACTRVQDINPNPQPPQPPQLLNFFRCPRPFFSSTGLTPAITSGARGKPLVASPSCLLLFSSLHFRANFSAPAT